MWQWLLGGLLGALISYGLTWLYDYLTVDEDEAVLAAIERLVEDCYDAGGVPEVERTSDNGFTVNCLRPSPGSSGGLSSTTSSFDDPDGNQQSEQSDFEPWYAYVDADGNVTFQ